MSNLFAFFRRRAMVIAAFVTSFFLASIRSSAQGWQWSGCGTGTQTSISQAIATDVFGNVFVAGSYLGDTLTVGNVPLPNAGDQNIFLAKYSPSGNVRWARRYGGMYTDGAKALATDSIGNVYIAGYFTSAQLRFDTSVIGNIYQNTVEGGESTADGFLAKVDSSGHGIWVRDIGGKGSDLVNAICVGPTGDVTVCGSFNSDMLPLGIDTMYSAGGDDIFLIRYDPAGHILWHAHAGGALADYAYSVATDTEDNVYMAGNFVSPSLSFGATTLTNSYSVNHVFLSMYSKTGAAQWATSAGVDNDAFATSVALDKYGYPYMVGTFSSSKIFFGSDTLYNATSFGSLFFVKYNYAGNMLWLRGASAHNNVFPQSVVCDSSGDLFCAGYFSSPTATLGSCLLVNSNTSGYGDVFLAKYSNAGDVRWVATAGGVKDDVAYGVAADRSGNVFISGNFSSADCYFGSIDDTSSQGTDFFVASLNVAKMAVTSPASATKKISVFPDPANDYIRFYAGDQDMTCITILDATGKTMYSASQLHAGQAAEIDVRAFANGVYTLRSYDTQGECQRTNFVVYKY